MKINKRVLRYIRKQGDFNLPEIMAEFTLDYTSAITILNMLKKRKKIQQIGDFRYKCVLPPKQSSTEDENDFEAEFEKIMASIESPNLEDDLEDVAECDGNFENECIEIIEKIILSDSKITRMGALRKVTETIELLTNSTDMTMMAVLQKVKEEFEQCSNQEFLMLKKQLHGNND